MTAHLAEPLSTDLIERYLRVRGRRYFRGQHDGEFFFVINTGQRRLHVHVEIPPLHPDVVAIRVTPACFFPAEDRDRLQRLAEEWNREHREITADVHRSSDPLRIGVAGARSQRMGGRVRFEDFTAFVDEAIGAAVELFDGLAPATELPTAPLLLDVG
ncbi:hypothetical protein BST27_08470 [Mycobacterium intermedium]|uniref:YbjN domain-containing protein n=1 Tax=Mycobacterium intermedium TaxID=28445 RepID=A0A1E3SDP7_MYCIE|nr:YbjN domain-containing protein [Mycobacterium intermedium]MCV6963992.1 YbjN domain-containing protein [Mycobacterium intermedium]ODR00269.1 hypothetical protein BHQ20_13815 [Mycobacterium intermedium]OPE51828.1 hypothetical protein BV508_05175 [Mycobacterium intermedium]ORB07897.1 hypothetical protein BST27_08470 [Mycobacterium intermedium]